MNGPQTPQTDKTPAARPSQSSGPELLDLADTEPSAKSSSRNGGDVGGEGNKSADRRYRAGVAKSIEDGDIEDGAAEAAKAIDDPKERAVLEQAERDAKRGPKKTDKS